MDRVLGQFDEVTPVATATPGAAAWTAREAETGRQVLIKRLPGDGAAARATLAICNSDQGSHFTSVQYLEQLQARAVQISMDGKGRALDNIFTERLWRTVKYEEVYLRDYDGPHAARNGLADYFEFYGTFLTDDSPRIGAGGDLGTNRTCKNSAIGLQ